MFNNLIESSSHISEMKRRGSFFLFTVLTYAIAFVIAGVASIYAYDARLDDPETEIVMLSPLDFPQVEQVAPQRPVTGAAAGPSRSNQYVRTNPTSTVTDTQRVPPTVSAAPNMNPPVPDGARFVVGNHNSDPGNAVPGATGNGGVKGTGGNSVAVDVGVPPPTPEPPKVTPPKLISKGVITSEALSLPKPAYPLIAKQARIQGTVSVQVLIDETGRVISAKAISGSPMLLAAAQKAALDARFSPTKLSGVPVKVSGVIAYNFVLQ